MIFNRDNSSLTRVTIIREVALQKCIRNKHSTTELVKRDADAKMLVSMAGFEDFEDNLVNNVESGMT